MDDGARDLNHGLRYEFSPEGESLAGPLGAAEYLVPDALRGRHSLYHRWLVACW